MFRHRLTDFGALMRGPAGAQLKPVKRATQSLALSAKTKPAKEEGSE
jgi:hypothetical protein